MKSLIVEDDTTSRMLLQEILKKYGPTAVAANGREAIAAFRAAMAAGEPFELVCLDIMMPEMNGQEALKEIRRLEHEAGVLLGNGVKIVMTTALGDAQNVFGAFREQCDAYLVKPIDSRKLADHLRSFGLAA